MNRIYKVIWSKVKHQYVVVSELAHRDGKRSGAVNKSVKTMLAVLAVCGMTAFGGLGMQDVYAGTGDGVTASQSQYVAIGGASYTDADNYNWRDDWEYNPKKEYYQTIDGHRYIYTETTAGNFWVREGYTIKVAHDQRFPGTDGGIDTVIETYKGEGADTEGILQSYQNVEKSMGITTLNNDTLYSTNTDMYVGAVNTPTTEIKSDKNRFYILRGNNWVNVGQDNFAGNFNYRDVIYDETTGLYTFHGEVVPTENLYVINGNVGVFTTTENGNEIYKGDVYGHNNEILVTGVDNDGKYVSYWGSENVDPNAPIGSMPISTLQYKFDVVNDNIKNIHKDDIKQINIGDAEGTVGNTDNGQGGTIGLQTNGEFDADGNPTGGAMIPGGITVSRVGGTGGKDVAIKFANDKGSFTVDAGSKVEAQTENGGNALTGLSINGEEYSIAAGGETYTAGNNIEISEDNVISATGLADTNLSNITTSGQTVIENLAKGVEKHIAPTTYTVDEDGNVTMTYVDGNGEAVDGEAKITGIATKADATAAKTEVKAGTNVASVGKSTDETDGHTVYTVNAEGAKVSGDDNFVITPETDKDTNVTDYSIKLADNITLGNEEGQHIQLNGNPEDGNNMISIANGEGDTVFSVAQDGTLSSDGDVFAYADNGKYSLSEVSQFAVRYDKAGGEVDTSRITLAGENGTTITNVAKGVNDSDAVNVAQLKDVETLAGKHTAMTVNGGMEALSVPEGQTEGEYNTDGNLQLKQTIVDGKTTYDVKLNDTIYLGGSHTAEDNNILLDGETGKIEVGSSIALDGSSGTAVIGGVNVKTTYDQDTGKPSSTITGLANTTWDNDLAAEVANSTELQGTAATQGQLKDLTNTVNTGWYVADGTTEADDKDGNFAVKPGETVTFNGDENIAVEAKDHEVNVSLQDNVSLGDGKIVLNGKPEEGDDLLNVDDKLVVAKDGTTTIAVSDGTVMGNNTTVTVGADGVTFAGYGNGSTLIDGQTIKAGNVWINNEMGSNTITGLSNTTTNYEGFATAGRAATEEQLKLAAEAATTTVSEGKNIDVSESTDAKDGHTNYEVSLQDNVSLGDGKIVLNGKPKEGDALLNVDDKLVVAQDGTTTIAVSDGTVMGNNTTVTVGADGVTFAGYGNGSTLIDGQTIKAGNVWINNEMGSNTITGLSNTTTNYEGFATAGRAATEEQLKLAAEAATTTVSEGKNIDILKTVDKEDGHTNYEVSLQDNVSLGDGKIVLNGKPKEGDDLLNVDDKLVVAQDGTTTIAVNDGTEMGNNTTVTVSADGVTFAGYGDGSTIINGQTIQAGGVFINDEGNGQITRLTNTDLDDPTFATVGRAATEEQLKLATDAATTTVSEGKNIDISKTVDKEDGHTNYEVSLQDNVSLGDGKIVLNGKPEEGDDLLNVDDKLVVAQDGTTTIAVNDGTVMGNNTTVTVGADGVTFAEYGNGSTIINGQTIQAGGVFINNGGNGQITGLTNVTWSGTTDDPSRAATEGQLQQAINDTKTELTNNDQRLVADKNSADGSYTVDANGDVTLRVEDSTGQGYDVTISDVASKTDLDKLEGLVGDGNYIDNETGVGNVVNNDMNVTEAIGALDSAIDEAKTEAGKHSTVHAGNGINVDTTDNPDTAGNDYTVSLDNDITLTGDDGTNSIHINANDGSITASGNITSAGTISAGATAISDKGVSVGDKTYITSEGINANNQKITNVAPGEISETSTDAVNGSQLFNTNMAVINNSNNIQMLSNSVNKLDTRIDRVGAGAAALAALHPLDFDPDAKWDFAAGYGNYRGANAVAVGAYYRPNEDLMFSVGGSMGGGENMVNAGLSVKIGAGSSHVTTSRVAMAKEIKAMRDVVAKQDAQIQKLTAMVNALVGAQAVEPDSTTMFPDVPENHWAYEAVATMAKSGLIQGYPDGEFKGDRTMTRYEFAQIIHNAIQAGLEVDARLIQEFKPELEYFHIATVAQDKDGNPTIQRVRAN